MTISSDVHPDRAQAEPAAGRRFRVWQWLIGALLLAAGAGLVWYYDFGAPAAPAGQFGGGPGGGRGRRPDEKPPVRVVAAQNSSIGVALRALGTVTPLNTVTVRSRLNGELVRVHFTEGQRVRQGQLLAEIDARPYEAALAEALGVRAENQARLNNAKADFATYQSLAEQQLIPRQQLTAQEALVKQVEGAMQSNDAQVNNARLQLSYTKMVAPISGRLGLRQVDVGNLVTSNDANGLVVITQMQPMSVLFTVPETELPAVLTAMRRDGKLTVQAWDRAETTQLATGTLQTVDNQIDTTTGSIRLRAVFDNADETLFPNQFVNIVLNLSTLRDSTVVPSATIQRASFGTFVYVITPEGKASVRRVTLGPAQNDRIAITEGLKPGERVVLEGVDALREGIAVEIIGTGGGAAPAATPTPGPQTGVATTDAPGSPKSGARR